jgi:MFS family permease
MILGPLIGSFGGLRTPFYINFVLAACVGLVALVWLRGAEMSERMLDYDYLAIIRRPGIVVACLTIMLLFASLGMMEVLFPLYMDSLSYTKAGIGALFLILSIFLVLGQPLTGLWMERHGPFAIIITGFGALALFLSLMVLCSSFRGWVPVFMVLGVFIGALTSASMLLIAQNSNHGEQGAAYGIWNFSFSVGYLWGPALGGLLSDFSHRTMPGAGFKMPFFFFSFLIICCMFFCGRLARTAQKGRAFFSPADMSKTH